MPAPAYHTYDRKVHIAARDADPDASQAQREAGNAAVGKFHIHGLSISLEYPKGSIRRGVGKGGKEWSRVVTAGYGYIRGTETASDKEQLDVWLGPHPASQVGFLVSFLDGDGNFDEYKTVLGVRNLNEAKQIIVDNYPPDFWETRVGEVRGFFLPDLKKHLRKLGVMKPRRTKAAEDRAEYDRRNVAAREQAKDSHLPHVREGYVHCRCGFQGYAIPEGHKCPECGQGVMLARSVNRKQAAFFCKGCDTFVRDRAEADGCPACDEKTKAARVQSILTAVRKATLSLGGEALDGIYVQVHPATGRGWVDLCDWSDPDVGTKLVGRLTKIVGKKHLEVVNEGLRPDAHESGWKKVAAGKPGLLGLLGTSPRPPAILSPARSGLSHLLHSPAGATPPLTPTLIPGLRSPLLPAGMPGVRPSPEVLRTPGLLSRTGGAVVNHIGELAGVRPGLPPPSRPRAVFNLLTANPLTPVMNRTVGPRVTTAFNRTAGAVSLGSGALATVMGPEMVRHQAVSEADATLARGGLPKAERDRVISQVSSPQKFYGEFLPGLVTDRTWVGDAHRRAAADLAVPYVRGQLHSLTTGGPGTVPNWTVSPADLGRFMGPGAGMLWPEGISLRRSAGRAFDVARSTTPVGAAATYLMHAGAEPLTDERVREGVGRAAAGALGDDVETGYHLGRLHQTKADAEAFGATARHAGASPLAAAATGFRLRDQVGRPGTHAYDLANAARIVAGSGDPAAAVLPTAQQHTAPGRAVAELIQETRRSPLARFYTDGDVPSRQAVAGVGGNLAPDAPWDVRGAVGRWGDGRPAVTPLAAVASGAARFPETTAVVPPAVRGTATALAYDLTDPSALSGLPPEVQSQVDGMYDQRPEAVRRLRRLRNAIDPP